MRPVTHAKNADEAIAAIDAVRTFSRRCVSWPYATPPSIHVAVRDKRGNTQRAQLLGQTTKHRAVGASRDDAMVCLEQSPLSGRARRRRSSSERRRQVCRRIGARGAARQPVNAPSPLGRGTHEQGEVRAAHWMPRSGRRQFGRETVVAGLLPPESRESLLRFVPERSESSNPLSLHRL